MALHASHEKHIKYINTKYLYGRKSNRNITHPVLLPVPYRVFQVALSETVGLKDHLKDVFWL